LNIPFIFDILIISERLLELCKDEERQETGEIRKMKPGDRAALQIALSPDLLWSASQFGLQCHL
jgi:hypothetical protein